LFGGFFSMEIVAYGGSFAAIEVGEFDVSIVF
jgi:hypothetical protein